VPVEVEGLIPSAVRGQSTAQIERRVIFHGKQQFPLAEMFHVAGAPDDGRMEFHGNLAGVHWIGAGMDGGEIRVAGTAGRHVGSEMTTGRITVEGDAGDWLGGQMRGGLIHVRGRAGHNVGGAYRGSPRGMTGGTILVDGPVGNETGAGMRRGLVAVGGAGDAIGYNLLAGTVLVFGSCGIRPGANMRRGTIGLFGPERPTLLPTFRYGCRLRPSLLGLIFTELARLGYPVDDSLRKAPYDLYHGDFLELGRGEILLPAI
jgi:formylmethanofuran dehydrogenase subunit C